MSIRAKLRVNACLGLGLAACMIGNEAEPTVRVLVAALATGLVPIP